MAGDQLDQVVDEQRNIQLTVGFQPLQMMHIARIPNPGATKHQDPARLRLCFSRQAYCVAALFQTGERVHVGWCERVGNIQFQKIVRVGIPDDGDDACAIDFDQ